MITDPNEIREKIKAGDWYVTWYGEVNRALTVKHLADMTVVESTGGAKCDAGTITAILPGPPCVAITMAQVEAIADAADLLLTPQHMRMLGTVIANALNITIKEA